MPCLVAPLGLEDPHQHLGLERRSDFFQAPHSFSFPRRVQLDLPGLGAQRLLKTFNFIKALQALQPTTNHIITIIINIIYHNIKFNIKHLI